MTAANSPRSVPRMAVLVMLAALIAFSWWLLSIETRDALVVYCAHDLMYAEDILRDFEQETGIPIVIVGDTEATKSLGLVQRLLREQDAPQCDVFWNNQMLGTVELARQGVLEPYKGRYWESRPERYRDEDGLWTGFGGRLRVWIINTDSLPLESLSFEELVDTASLSAADGERMAIALPLFGTTLSHYAVLHDQRGAAGLEHWHRQLVDAGVRVVPGNATVKDLVAEGVCVLGMTDTDDYFQAVDAGKPVAMRPIEPRPGETICIPNTVAIIRGTDKLAPSQRLVDFLLSPENELRMARSKSRQIPLGSVDPTKIPDDVKPLVDWSERSVDLKGLADSRTACLTWLTEEYAP